MSSQAPCRNLILLNVGTQRILLCFISYLKAKIVQFRFYYKRKLQHIFDETAISSLRIIRNNNQPIFPPICTAHM